MAENIRFYNCYTCAPDYGVDYMSDEEMKAVTLFQDYPKSLLNFASACCVLFVLIGIPGNLTTIIALAKCRKVRNSTAIFIINLHIGDLIVCCTVLPLTATTFAYNHWIYGIPLCRAYAFFTFSLNAVSISITLAITINRYVMVCHPAIYPRLYKRRNLTLMILSAWVAGFAMFLPSIFGVWGRFNLHPTGGFCTMLQDKYHNSPKMFFMLVGFFGPCLIIALLYARLWWVVTKTAKNSRPDCKPSNVAVMQTLSISSNEETTRSSVKPLDTIYEDEISSSPASSPVETDKTPQRYFRAPFRSTRRENKLKMPTRRDKRLCTMIVAIILSFCICHTPIMTTRIFISDYKSHPTVNILAHVLENSGWCINPIIYVLMSKEYRQAYQSLFGSFGKRFQNRQVVFV